MSINIKDLDKAYKWYLDSIFDNKKELLISNSGFIIVGMGVIREIILSQQSQITNLKERVKRLEQKQTYYPFTEEESKKMPLYEGSD